MTALKPMENRRVRGVASERYPSNQTCSHVECVEAATDQHHCFPRSAIGNASWFVEITDFVVDFDTLDGLDERTRIIPHVTGLCRKHHDQVELHSAWIKLHDDGQFVWYDRVENSGSGWLRVGPLDPQPGGREKTRKPRKRFQGEQKRQRTTISFKVPADEQEDGAGVYDELLEQMREILGEPEKPPYYLLVLALFEWIQNNKTAKPSLIGDPNFDPPGGFDV